MSRMVALLGFGCSIAVAGAQENALSLVQMNAQRRSDKQQVEVGQEINPMGLITSAKSWFKGRKHVDEKADEDENQTETSGVVTSASHWGPSSTCTVTDDTYFSVFDLPKVSLLQADIDTDTDAGFKLKDILQHDGEHKDLWLVRGRAHDDSTVRIAARYWRNESDKGHQVFLKSLAIGGGFITNRTLIIRPQQDNITWWNRKETKTILETEESTFNIEGLLNATRKTDSKQSTVEVQLPKGVKMLVTRHQKYVTVAITMPPLAVQDGLCGNFNGDAKDDKMGMILARGPRVQDQNSLFPAEFVPAVQHTGEAQMQLGEAQKSGAILEEGRTSDKEFEDELESDNVSARVPNPEELAADESYDSTLSHGGGSSAVNESSWASEWAGNEAVSCASGEVFGALYSEHANGKADRRWKYTCEAMDNTHANLTGCRWSGWTAWSKAWYVTGNGNEVMTGMESYYDATKQDRRYKFEMCTVTFVNGATGGISNNLGYGGLLNNWTNPVDHYTSTSQFLTGIYSEHNERLVDRRWKFERKVFKFKVDAVAVEQLQSPTTGEQTAEPAPNVTDSDSPVAEAPAAEAPAAEAPANQTDVREENGEIRQEHHEESAAEHEANADAREEKAEIREEDHEEIAAERQAKDDAREEASSPAVEAPAVEAPAAVEPAPNATDSDLPACISACLPACLPTCVAGGGEAPAAATSPEAPVAEEPFVEKAEIPESDEELAARLAAEAAAESIANEPAPFQEEEPEALIGSEAEEEEEAVLQQVRKSGDMDTSICSVAGEPHITVFDGKQISLFQADGMFLEQTANRWTTKNGVSRRQFDLHNIKDGETTDVWLVNGHAANGKTVSIQARYTRNDSMPERQVFVKSLAIGGDILANNTLVIRPLTDSITFQTPEGRCKDILIEQESKFKIKGVFKAKRHMNASLVENPSIQHPGVEIKLKNNLRLLINRQQHYVNVMITMPPLESQDGLCGNFNGNSADDSLEMIEERDPRVDEGESLFPVA